MSKLKVNEKEIRPVRNRKWPESGLDWPAASSLLTVDPSVDAAADDDDDED